MSFVIYNTRTYARMKSPSSRQQLFETERAAKTIRTKVLKKEGATPDEAAEWVVAEYSVWQAADPEIEVISVMSQKPVKIKASQRGNPAVDPSMEGHWTA